jgi:hypothetical protein
LFDNTPEIDVTISGLTLTGGEVAYMPGDPTIGQPGSPDFRFEGGGAILNYENLTLVNSVISNSHAQNGGGGIGAQLANGVAAADSTKFCVIWSLAA